MSCFMFALRSIDILLCFYGELVQASCNSSENFVPGFDWQWSLLGWSFMGFQNQEPTAFLGDV